MGSLLPLLLLSTICSGHTIHHIKPTPSASCAADPCFTLSEYAQQLPHNLTSNTTLLLLPGDHVLSVNFTVENVNRFKILSSAHVDSHETRIVCQGLVGFSFTNISHVTMYGLTINSCGKGAVVDGSPTTYGVSVRSVLDTSITDCSFQDSVGTALEVLDSSLDMRGSNHFTSNCRRCFERNYTCLCFGGGISASMSTLMLIGNSTFRVNSATLGGGIAAEYSVLNLTGNATFEKNTAEDGGGIYAYNSTLNFNGSSTFGSNSAVIGGGIEALYSTLINFNGNSIFGNNSANYGAGIHAETSTLNFSGRTTFGNNSVALYGGGIGATRNAVVNFNGNTTFRSNSAAVYGGGIDADVNTLMNFNGNSIFRNNSAAYGGGVSALNSFLIFSGSSTFGSSLAVFGGGVYAQDNTLINFIGNNIFRSNSAAYGGGIYARKSSINFSGNNTFGNNSAESYGGGIGSANSALITFNGNSIFGNNSAEYGGVIYTEGNSTLNFSGNITFGNNSAERYGGGIFVVYLSFVNFNGNSNFRNNSAEYGGGIYAQRSTLNLSGNITFRSNSAERYGGGVIAVYKAFMSFHGNSIFKNNYAAVAGGGIYAKVSTLSITGNGSGSIENCAGAASLCTSIFAQNSAVIHGGAVYAEDSVLSFQGHNVICGNSAQYSAGGIYSKNSTLTFSGNTTFSSNSGRLLGGGIYGFETLLKFVGNSSFTANTAARGGGEYLVNSFNLLSHDASVTMDSNNATEYGGAVYVKDSDPISYCFADITNLERCFYQVDGSFETSSNYILLILSDPAALKDYLQSNESTAHAIRALLNIGIHFHNNYAQRAGNAVYGGSVENCAISLGYKTNFVEDSVSFNWHIPNFELEPNSVSSDPFQVCLCKDGFPNCNTSESELMRVYPGQLIKLPVVATGQRDGIVPAVVRAMFNSMHENVSLAPFQDTQNVNNTCTELDYQVHSSATNSSGTLVLYADGPCSTDGKLLVISLEFLDCPRGFSLNPSEGTCECEPRLQQYTTRCNITERTLEAGGEFWVGYDNNFQGLVLHPHCPFDYCVSAHMNVTLNDTDKQCANNRAGLLCGECKSGFSLAFGSSKCLQCSNIWILLLVPFALAGIALVLLLFILKLTVAAGSINGLIFYANIVAVNRSLFFPPNETNILTVFIAWLNLDLGIETCFFDGLDAYGKTWLQFVFPLYVWSLAGLIIIGSKYSSRITKVFGSNPVAVLATLFLLSYAKLLRTILAALTFTFLDYPDEVRVAVWQYDANILYIHGKHIALFIVALLKLLVLFLPYTFLLTVGQWSNRRFFYWINKPRIKPFLDAYQAPYRDQNRYWTGLMLCLRFVLFTVFAIVPALADPIHNLLAIGVAVIGLFTLIHFTGFIYKKLYLDVLEASFILNLGILSAATYSVRIEKKTENKAAVTYLSVGIAFATFVGVLVYHMYQQVRPKLQPKINQLLHCKKHRSETVEEAAQTSTTHTVSIVECPGSASTDLESLSTFVELREPFLSMTPVRNET